MLTLYDLGLEITKMREAADSIEMKGRTNAARVVFIIDKCNELIRAINEAADAVKNVESANEQDGEDILNIQMETDDTIVSEDGDDLGEPHSGATQ